MKSAERGQVEAKVFGRGVRGKRMY